MKRILLPLVVATITSAALPSAAAWPGKITNTTTTQPYCIVAGHPWGQITYYNNWTYTDTAGVSHPFSGTSYQIAGSAANCPAQSSGGFTSYSTVANGRYKLSTNGANYTLSITATIFPKFHILSLLYDAPGNKSSNGFTDSTFYGTTNSIDNSFSVGLTYSYSATGGIFGIGSGVSSSVSFTNGFGTTNAFTDTFFNGQGLTLASTRNPIDHTKDTFWVWLNPEVDVEQTSATNVNYTVAPPSGQVMDAVRVSVSQLQHPSTIPLTILKPITINGVAYPGLSNICAHPLPAAQCTAANACGCVPSDFTQILKTDPIISITKNTPPSQIDSKRYFALNPPPSPFPLLEYGTSDTISVTDQHQSGQTQTETTQYQTMFSTQYGTSLHSTPVDWSLQFKVTDTFTWTQTVSLTNFNGTQHQMQLILNTSTPNCASDIDVFEDYVYHTFVESYAATPPAACNSN